MSGKRFIIVFFCTIALIVIGAIIFSSVIFETDKPKLILEDNNLPTHWNLKDEMTLQFSDESGIRHYRVRATLEGEVLSDEKEILLTKAKSVKINLPKPPTTLKDGTIIQYYIEVTDWSNARFFRGNTAKFNIDLVVDTTPPSIKPIASSYQISRGGSAIVAFEIEDMSLENIIVSNGIDEFKLFKYLGDNLYVGVIAWPLKNNFFNAQVIVKDKAGNIKQHTIPIAKNLNSRYYRSNIRLKKNFLNGKLNELIDQIDPKLIKDFDNDIDRFVFFNENIRNEDENRILEACTNISSNQSFIDENFRAFTPLKGSKLVGNFGDYRTYYLGDTKVSQATHLGIDIASTKNAPIIASNRGIVLLKKSLGLYGNTTLLHHGLGVSSIYAHMAGIQVEIGDELQAGDIIGTTGSSGWAFGDHLHFGILVQGHFVMLAEWLDQKWINNNIHAVLEKTNAYYNARSGKHSLQ